ncbi:unnamed protein product [Cylicocyclus nassatus]|uniref:Chitin-binding type-2 domain-containing protein n=1 Tax=Cylicocyclus nassatus TaxID=53992 RepID=A0AA36HI22_CYLNA|nr:unnamed protein product [Cylicocyclus nassatus]
MQASMNCPAGTFFEATRKTCDFKERVVACGGSLDEPIPSVHSPVVARTTTPASVHAHSCAAPLQPLGRCSSKFVACSDGELSESHCFKPLVFNPLTITCDFREFVSECAEYKGADAPTTQVVTTTVQTTTTTEAHKCVFNEKRQAFAFDYCAREYGLCSKRGVVERAECTVGFLFDAHLNTCVPAEQCGQRKLEAVLSKIGSLQKSFLQHPIPVYRELLLQNVMRNRK